jgi:hypothetical protein
MKRDGQGNPVVTAANGKEALEIYAREQLNIRLVVKTFGGGSREGVVGYVQDF